MIPTYTGFYREPNIARFSEDVAPDIAHEMGGRLLIGQIGCSSGQETWTMAATLTANAVDFHIDAYDIDEEALSHSSGPYPIQRPRSLQHIVEDSIYPQASLNHLNIREIAAPPEHPEDDVKRYEVLPNDDIASKVTFHNRDIRRDLPRARQYGAVVMNNILYHYSSGERDELFDAGLQLLQPGGAVLIESFYRKRSSGYLLWRMNLGRTFGLKPALKQDEAIPTVFRKPID